MRHMVMAALLAMSLLISSCNTTQSPANPQPNATAAASVDVNQAPSDSQAGNISGKLIYIKEDGSRIPFNNADLYLGELIGNEQNPQAMASMSRQTAPKSNTDANGNFIFQNVKPGNYTLWIDTPRGAIMLNAPTDGKNFVFQSTAGKVTNLGDLPYNLPFPPQ